MLEIQPLQHAKAVRKSDGNSGVVVLPLKYDGHDGNHPEAASSLALSRAQMIFVRGFPPSGAGVECASEKDVQSICNDLQFDSVQTGNQLRCRIEGAT